MAPVGFFDTPISCVFRSNEMNAILKRKEIEHKMCAYFTDDDFEQLLFFVVVAAVSNLRIAGLE